MILADANLTEHRWIVAIIVGVVSIALFIRSGIKK